MNTFSCYICSVLAERVPLYHYATGRTAVLLMCQECGDRFSLHAITEENAQQRAQQYANRDEPKTPLTYSGPFVELDLALTELEAKNGWRT